MYGTVKKPLGMRLIEMLGFRHVPDNYVQVIERYGRYHRAVDGPFVRRRVFSESFGAQIRVGIRLVDQVFENVISRDGVPHSIRVAVKIYFDLRQASRQMAVLIVQNGEALVTGRVASLIEVALRREVGQLESTKLLLPEVPLKLEKAIKERLKKIDVMGVSLLEVEDAIVVKGILPPVRMQENRTEATNIEETIASFLRQAKPEQIRSAILAHLLRDIGKQRPLFKALNVPEDLTLPTDDILDPSYRVLRHPTGRIYDN